MYSLSLCRALVASSSCACISGSFLSFSNVPRFAFHGRSDVLIVLVLTLDIARLPSGPRREDYETGKNLKLPEFLRRSLSDWGAGGTSCRGHPRLVKGRLRSTAVMHSSGARWTRQARTELKTHADAAIATLLMPDCPTRTANATQTQLYPHVSMAFQASFGII